MRRISPPPRLTPDSVAGPPIRKSEAKEVSSVYAARETTPYEGHAQSQQRSSVNPRSRPAWSLLRPVVPHASTVELGPIPQEEKVEAIEQYIHDQLDKLGSDTREAEAMFQKLDQKDREIVRPFLETMRGLNEQMARNLNELRDNTYRNRIIEVRKLLGQSIEWCERGAKGASSKVKDRLRILPGSGHSETTQQSEQLRFVQHYQMDAYLHYIDKIREDALGYLKTCIEGNPTTGQKGSHSIDSSRIEVATNFLNKVFPESEPEGAIFDYVRQFCPEAAQVKQRKWHERLAPTSSASISPYVSNLRDGQAKEKLVEIERSLNELNVLLAEVGQLTFSNRQVPTDIGRLAQEVLDSRATIYRDLQWLLAEGWTLEEIDKNFASEARTKLDRMREMLQASIGVAISCD